VKLHGRPTDYLPEYDQALYDHMAEGFTYESFAGRIGVARATIYGWEAKHPSFMDAKNAGREAQLFANERTMHGIAKGKLRDANVTAQIFIMKNCHRWVDRHEVEASEETKQALKLAYPSP
jgi:hypothetical protein